MSNLNYRLQEFKTTFESGAPPYNASPEVVAVMHVYVSPGSGMLLALGPVVASCHLITYQEAV